MSDNRSADRCSQELKVYTTIHYKLHYFLNESFSRICSVTFLDLYCIFLIFTCAHAASKYCFWRRLCVCLCACPHEIKIDVTWQEYVQWWTLEVVGSWWNLTFTFESYFRIFRIQARSFEWLDRATSFSVWRYIFKISRSHSVSRSCVQGQGHCNEFIFFKLKL